MANLYYKDNSAWKQVSVRQIEMGHVTASVKAQGRVQIPITFTRKFDNVPYMFTTIAGNFGDTTTHTDFIEKVQIDTGGYSTTGITLNVFYNGTSSTATTFGINWMAVEQN